MGMIQNNINFSKLTTVVKNENKLWLNGTLYETDKRAEPMLNKYWQNVRGTTYTTKQLSSDAWQDGNPWSAVYVSWIMVKGFGDSSFPKAAAHRSYAKAAMKNRNNSTSASGNSWKLFSLSREKVKAQVGDVVVGARSGGYNNTHGDIVWKISGGKAYLAGGNVGWDAARKISFTNKIDMTTKLNSDGSYTKNAGGKYNVVLKKM
jgi:hypothetical protein